MAGVAALPDAMATGGGADGGGTGPETEADAMAAIDRAMLRKVKPEQCNGYSMNVKR